MESQHVVYLTKLLSFVNNCTRNSLLFLCRFIITLSFVMESLKFSILSFTSVDGLRLIDMWPFCNDMSFLPPSFFFFFDKKMANRGGD